MGAHAPFRDKKKTHRHNSRSAVRIFKKIFHNERGQEVYKNYNNHFSEKIVFWDNLTIFGNKMTNPHNSGSTLSMFLKDFAQ